VRDGHAIGIDRRERLSEKSLPGKTPRDLERYAMFARFARNVSIADHGGHTKTIGKSAAERRIGIAFNGTNVVIKMREAGEYEVSGGGEIMK
jgi:hypothetical protein